MKYSAFVSYSSHDGALVQPLVQLLKVGKRRVFWDQASIEPGDDWRRTLEEAIGDCETLVVFWCCHAQRSEWVEHEVREAQRHGKPIVPVLLCGERLPGLLAQFQWIDCRHGSLHACLAAHEAQQGEPPSSDLGARAREVFALPPAPVMPRVAWGMGAFVGTALLLFVGAGVFMLPRSASVDYQPIPQLPMDPHPPPATDTSYLHIIGAVLMLLALTAAVGLIVKAALTLMRRLSAPRPPQVAQLPPETRDLAQVL
ncbi:MAG TPA: toll/interleukin-1 receptor domain-containing protein, partial [Polyangiaceae bacterium]|nr:toll/interleukin-1 receptor domain-containing protein [Polyangiaceae bacterium]